MCSIRMNLYLREGFGNHITRVIAQGWVEVEGLSVDWALVLSVSIVIEAKEERSVA